MRTLRFVLKSDASLVKREQAETMGHKVDALLVTLSPYHAKGDGHARKGEAWEGTFEAEATNDADAEHIKQAVQAFITDCANAGITLSLGDQVEGESVSSGNAKPPKAKPTTDPV